MLPQKWPPPLLLPVARSSVNVHGAMSFTVLMLNTVEALKARITVSKGVRERIIGTGQLAYVSSCNEDLGAVQSKPLGHAEVHGLTYAQAWVKWSIILPTRLKESLESLSPYEALRGGYSTRSMPFKGGRSGHALEGLWIHLMPAPYLASTNFALKRTQLLKMLQNDLFCEQGAAAEAAPLQQAKTNRPHLDSILKASDVRSEYGIAHACMGNQIMDEIDG
eukprot:524242-Pelagomonas_calceolata.AAC.2